jgi:hypothetical protein
MQAGHIETALKRTRTGDGISPRVIPTTGLAVTARGLSTSVGAGPLRLSRGADGKVRRTIRVPGTGIYDTNVISPPVKHPHPSDYGSTHAAGVQPRAPTNKRGLIIAGSIVGVVILLLLLGNMDKHGGSDTTPAPTTVTKTVTAPAQAAPVPRLVETAPPSAPVPLPQSSCVYYENCDAARRDGASPIMTDDSADYVGRRKMR